MLSLFDPAHLIETLKVFGYVGIAGIIFAESGLFFGFFLPGDSLLVTAGILAGSSVFSLPVLFVVIVVSAVLGDSVGYWFGNFVGKKLLTRKSSFFFRHEHIERARVFYERHGSKAIVLARFVPVVRTFVPIIAGVASMPYQKFFMYNVIGGTVWGIGLTSLGYILGSRVANIDTYLLPIIITIICISSLPVVIEVVRARTWKKQ